jgi:predicted transcriptional regulator
LANTSSYTDAAYSPPPSNDLITAELKRQKDATETVMWEATQLAKSYDELQKVIKDMAAVARGISFLSAALGQTDQRVARIEKQLGQIFLGPASETNATPGLQIEEPDVPR